MATSEPILGIILAGGLSRRMGGGDKGLRLLAGRSILQRVSDCLRPQVTTLLVNANGDPSRLDTDLPIVPDSVPDNPGPLAGILAGLDYAAVHLPNARWLLSAPADCPFLPDDLALRLRGGLGGGHAAFAVSGDRPHPVIGLWNIDLRHDLRRQIVEHGERRVGKWTGAIEAVSVKWSDRPYDPFFNINTPGDIDEAQRILAAYPEA